VKLNGETQDHPQLVFGSVSLNLLPILLLIFSPDHLWLFCWCNSWFQWNVDSVWQNAAAHSV